MSDVHGIFIKGVSLPECCGECFAYDEFGCKFIDNVDKLHHKVWESRAEKCPLQACRTTCSMMKF